MCIKAPYRYSSIILIILCAISIPVLAQNKQIDSLLTLIKSCKEDTNKVKTLNKLCWQYKGSGNYDSALKAGKQALALGERLKFKNGIGESYYHIGVIYMSQGNNPEALKNFSAGLKIKEETGDKKGIAGTYSNIGIIYHDQGNYPEALRNHFTALKIREEIGYKQGIAGSYNNIGTIFMLQGNYTESLKSYLHSLKIKEEIGDRQGIATSYNNIGNIYYSQGDYPQALKNHFISLKIKEEIGDKKGKAYSYSNIGSIYYNQGNYPEALKNYFASLKIKEEIGDKKGIAACYNNIGMTFVSLKKPRKAEEYMLKDLALSKEIRFVDAIKSSYQGLARLDSLKGDFKSALKNYKLYILYRDSLLNEENTKKTIQQQMQYDFDKRTTTDSIKNNEARKLEELKHAQEISRQKTFTYAGIGGFLVMIIVAGISYSAFRNKKRANIEISKQKAIVEEKQKEILDSIHYAKRIQRALITNEKYIERSLFKLRKK